MITFQYNLNEVDLDTVFKLFQRIKDSFPDETVIAIPDCCSITTMNKEELVHFRDYVNSVIDNL